HRGDQGGIALRDVGLHRHAQLVGDQRTEAVGVLHQRVDLLGGHQAEDDRVGVGRAFTAVLVGAVATGLAFFIAAAASAAGGQRQCCRGRNGGPTYRPLHLSHLVVGWCRGTSVGRRNVIASTPRR